MKPKAAPSPFPLPTGFDHLRDHQVDAIEDILAAYENGAKVVFLDAPTGAGKSLIALVVAQEMAHQAIYMCSTLSLQDQLVRDFPDAKVLKGRSNYEPTDAAAHFITCEDCDREKIGEDEWHCTHCFDTDECPYRVAKEKARRAEVAIVNTAYFLAETQNPDASVFCGRDLGIIDECDLVENALMRQVEFVLSKKMAKDLGITPPPKGSHQPTIQSFITEILVPALRGRIGRLHSDDIETQRLKRSYVRLLAQAKVIDLLDNDYWVRDNGSYHPLHMKPYRVHLWGQERIWSKAERWLCMSATIISADEMAASLGLEDDEWELVEVPMTFPVENRPTYYVPVGSMTRKHLDGTKPKLAKAISTIAENHEGENILVHAHSYALSNDLAEMVNSPYHTVYSYSDSKGRDRAISLFDAPNTMVIAPSLNRGVDLPGAKCSVQIIAKVPYPYLGDPLVSKRLHDDMGELWYRSETARSIVQSTGRAIRSPEDHATTYILDSGYGGFLNRGGRSLLPEWWLESVTTRPVRSLSS